MTFPSDYKIVQQPGGTDGVIAIQLGVARQLLINTTDWSVHLMDGTTPGGHKMVSLGNLPEYLQDSDIITKGTRLAVETAAAPTSDDEVLVWSAQVMRSLFEKFVDTSTAGSWRVKDTGMPFNMRAAALNVNDLNDATTDGFYVADPASVANLPAGIPTNNNINVGVLVIAQSVDNLIQVLFQRDGSGKIYTRVKKDLVWESWVLSTGVTTSDLNQKFDKTGGNLSGSISMQGNDINNLGKLNGAKLGRFNYIINGVPVVNQRATVGTVVTTSGYNAEDRWRNEHVGSTKNHSVQEVATAELANWKNSRFFARTAFTSVAGAANYVRRTQRIEDVRKLAGKKLTVSALLKADSAKDIAIEIVQNFGTGGSPSAEVTGIGVTRKTIGTGVTRIDAVVDIPSIAAKTLGTDDNSYTEIIFWYEAGSNFNSRTLNLGQQSGTIEATRISVVEGDATEEDDPFETRSEQEEIRLCKRFSEFYRYQATTFFGISYFVSTSSYWFESQFEVTKRAVPSFSIVTGGWVNGTTPTIHINREGFQFTSAVVTYLLGSSGAVACGFDSEL